jgi:hypothetical protein
LATTTRASKQTVASMGYGDVVWNLEGELGREPEVQLKGMIRPGTSRAARVQILSRSSGGSSPKRGNPPGEDVGGGFLQLRINAAR